MRAYLEYVRDESKRHFDAGLTSLEAATRIEFDPTLSPIFRPFCRGVIH
jgi:hypothetical protein